MAGISHTFWDVLVPAINDAVSLARRVLKVKDFIFRTKYLGVAKDYDVGI